MHMESKKRILIITDSLGLPRAFPEACSYEQTWPVLLKKSNYIIHQISIGGATINELYRQIEYHYLFSPDIIIIQSGIVDCAPRALGKFESLFLNHFFITRKLLECILPKCNLFLRKYRRMKYTSAIKYQYYIESMKKRFPGKDVYWIGILPSSEEYEKRVPGISTAIALYNSILKKCLGEEYLAMDAIPKEGIMPDFIHLNQIGHKYVNDIVSSQITIHLNA